MAVGLSYAWGAIAPLALTQTHWSSLEVALVTSATPGFYGLGMVAGGRLADLVPPRRLMWLGWLALAAGYSIAFARPSPFTFVVFYAGLGQGFGGGFSMAASLAAFRQVFGRSIGTAGGALVAWFVGSALLVVPVLTALAVRTGWVSAVELAGSVLVGAACLGLLAMPSLPRPRHEQHAASGRPPFLSLLRRPPVLFAVLAELLVTPLGSSTYVHIGPYAYGLGAGLAVASGAAAATVAGNAAGRIVGGLSSDRVGVDRVLAGVAALSLACALVLATRPGGPLLLVAALLLGVGFGAPNGVMPRLSAEVAPDAPNTAFGLIFVGFAAGSFSGPLLGELAGNRPSGWLLMALFPAGALAALAARRIVSRA